MSDLDIEALQRGDEDRWREFFAQYDPLLRSIVSWSKWQFAPHTADDLIQETRSELMGAIRTFKGDSTIAYFVKRVCMHRCVDEVRRQIRARKNTISMADESLTGWEPRSGDAYDPVRVIARSERALALKQLVARLDRTCEEAIRLFYLDGLSYKEISARLEIAVNTVGSRLAKCLGKLRELVGHDAIFKEEVQGAGRQPVRSSE